MAAGRSALRCGVPFFFARNLITSSAPGSGYRGGRETVLMARDDLGFKIKDYPMDETEFPYLPSLIFA
jgi:hypothetical protein